MVNTPSYNEPSCHVTTWWQPSAAAGGGSVQLHRPHCGPGEHFVSLQPPGEPEPGGSAAVRHRHQVLCSDTVHMYVQFNKYSLVPVHRQEILV